MMGQEGRDIQDLAVDDDPGVLFAMVGRDILPGEDFGHLGNVFLRPGGFGTREFKRCCGRDGRGMRGFICAC